MSKNLLPFHSVTRLRMEVDGEGVTTLVGAYGCPLDCKLCINQGLRIRPEQCKMISCEELYDKVRVDNLYFLATGGGLTFGGGEALLHTDFISEFVSLYGNNWKITVETSLNVAWTQIEKGIQCIDYYIVDIKSLDSQKYLAYTGSKQNHVLESLLKLRDRIGEERITVRVPQIPGFKGAEEQEREVIRLREMGFTHIDAFTYIDPQKRKP